MKFKLVESIQFIPTTKDDAEVIKPKQDIIVNNKILMKSNKYYFIKDFITKPGLGLCAYTVDYPEYYIPMSNIEQNYDLFIMKE